MTGIVGVLCKDINLLPYYQNKLKYMSSDNTNIFLRTKKQYLINSENIVCAYATSNELVKSYISKSYGEQITFVLGNIHAIEKCGANINSIDKYCGFFTIVRYYPTERKLTIISDVARSNPVYFIDTPQVFAFSSEIKSLCYLFSKEVKLNWLRAIRNNMYSEATNNIWNVNETKPQSIMTIKGNSITVEKWPLLKDKLTLSETIDVICNDVKEAGCYDSILISGGIDSCLLAHRLEINDAYTLYGKPFEASGDYTTSAAFCKEYGIKLHAVSLPEPDTFIKDAYKLLLYAFENLSLNVESWLKSCAFRRIRDHMKNGVITGTGSDELFGGYSGTYSSYIEYQRSTYYDLLSNKISKCGLQPEKISFFDEVGLPNLFDISANEREAVLTYEIEKCSYNGLYQDMRNSAFFCLQCYSPFLSSGMVSEARDLNSENQLYNKTALRDYAIVKGIAKKYACRAKNPFIYNNYYQYIFEYIYSLLTYKQPLGESLLSEAMSTKAFSEHILDKDYFQKFVNSVFEGKGDYELIEVILRIINLALLYDESELSWKKQSKMQSIDFTCSKENLFC
ncbi:MAG: asparagine synthase-related protein [Acutalibacter sp.]